MTGTQRLGILPGRCFVFASLSRILRFARSQTPPCQCSRSHDMGRMLWYTGYVDSREVLALYDATMRKDPAPAAGVRYERIGPVVRSVGLWNVVLFWELADRDAAVRAVDEQAAYARAAGLALEWKLFEHDRPAGLAAILQRAGFVADESETLMVLDLGVPALAELALGDGVEIRRVVDAAGVDDFMAVANAAFGRNETWKTPAYLQSLEDDEIELFVVYCDGLAVSSGRLNLPERRAFASMWGGSTLREYRGLGLYRALVARRAEEARRRGYRFLTTDARETSRPILQRLGFVRLSGITGWVLRP